MHVLQRVRLDLVRVEDLRDSLEMDEGCLTVVGEHGGCLSPELYTGNILPPRHVGNDHAVSDRKALENFHGIHRGAAKLHGDGRRVAAVLADLEKTHGALGEP
jgi:hypothetical protein